MSRIYCNISPIVYLRYICLADDKLCRHVFHYSKCIIQKEGNVRLPSQRLHMAYIPTMLFNLHTNKTYYIEDMFEETLLQTK